MTDRSTDRSHAAWAAAQAVIPGGVNSPVRAYAGVGGEPLFIQSAAGARITDVDGNTYLDYVASWGPLILGHAAPAVVDAVCEVARGGTSFGAPTEGETALAQTIVEAVPSIEQVRLVNSGTEATMSALRLARGATGRDGILKFEGGYHGHVDALLVQAGSGLATLGVPTSPGIPSSVAATTCTAPYNDLEAVSELFAQRPDEIAAVIVEPVAGNMGMVPPVDGFLQGLRDLCTQHGALLIFDEVITGFRVARGGAQALYGVQPDITTLGKIIGGGLPVGAYGASRALMSHMAPAGPVYQAGTLSGNPLAVAAGLAMLRALAGPGLYDALEATGRQFATGLRAAAAEAHVALHVNQIGSLCGLFFRAGAPRNYAEVQDADADRYARFFHGMLERGHAFAPSAFECCFVSIAHTADDIAATVAAAREVFAGL